ncbi:MAG TPA: glycosyltransferase [Opitutaceae bacterium]|nr:glycosyltransferase [Opitutaceae bacterium]
MKIAQIVPSMELRQGGPSVSVPNLAAALAGLGHDVELLATEPGPGTAKTEGAMRVETFRRDWPQRLCPSAGLRARLGQSDAEIIHHHSLWLRTLHYAHQRTSASGAKLVLSPRGMMNRWAWNHHQWRKQIARALVHPGALGAVDGWHATSDEEAADIKALGFKQPVCVAPNGVVAPELSKKVRDAEYWLATCPAVGTRPVALFYSRFHQKKRVLELVDLWLKEAPRDWLLLLVGIPQEYTPEMIDQYVLHASGAGRVMTFSGEDRPPPYGVASVFLLPSHSENFGLVIAEAMAHGVPALVTDGTPWAGINDDGRGWCVPWESYGEALRAATAETHDQLRARGARARDWVVAEYSWEKSARDLAGFYGQLKESS